MIKKSKKRITITIPKALEKHIRKRAKEYKITVSEEITIQLNDHYYEYDRDYEYEEVEKEIKND